MTKTDILLMLLYADHSTAIVGTTRLQKLLFLVEHEKQIKGEKESFDFEAFKFGPASKTLYDDIEFLVNIGLLEKTGEDSKINEFLLAEMDNINANDLLNDIMDVEDNFKDVKEDCYKERDENFYVERDEETAGDDLIVYRITEKGINYLKENNLINVNEANKIAKIKKKYSKKSLVELLKYVYIHYPNYTTESEITDQLL